MHRLAHSGEPFCLRTLLVASQEGNHAQSSCLHLCESVRRDPACWRHPERLHAWTTAPGPGSPSGSVHGAGDPGPGQPRLLQRQRGGHRPVRGSQQREASVPGPGRRGGGPEQGHPEQGRAPGRRLLRGGQHLPEPGFGGGHLRALRFPAPGADPRRAGAGLGAPAAARGLRLRQHQRRPHLVPGAGHPSARDPGRPDQAHLPGPLRGGEPGHLLPWAGLSHHHRGPLRGGGLPGLLGGPAGERRPGHRWLERGLLRALHRGLRRQR